MALQTYQVRVKDRSGSVVAILAGVGRTEGKGGLVTLDYRRRLRTPGNATIYIDGNDDRIPDLKLINGQIEIWRRDQQAGLTWLAGLPSWRRDGRTTVTGWYKDWEGFIRAWNRGFTDRGRRIFALQARQYNDLLLSETINYTSGSSEADKSGLPGAVAAEFVNENIGAGAGNDALGNSRVRAGLTEVVESDTATTWAGGRSNKNLLDVLLELAEFGPGDFMVSGTGAATFEFRWRATRWGLDRTPGNTAGNVPCVFSVFNNNVTNVQFGYNALDEVNVVYVGGQGQGSIRNYRTRASAEATAFNWSRRAVFRDARDSNVNGVLDNRGDAILEEQRARYLAAFDVLQTTATRYGRDWDMGDLIRFTDEDGEDFDLKIEGVRVSISDTGNDTIRPELETEA